MPAPIISREEVVRRLFDAFRTYGYEGASLSRLSEATGLGRASLYHYFPDGKEGMAREVLNAARSWLLENVKAPLEREKDAPATRLRTAMRNLIEGYDGGAESCLVNLLGVGDARAVAGDVLEDAARIYLSGFESFLKSCGLSAGAARDMAFDTVARIEGALVVARALDDRKSFVKCIERLEKQYLKLLRTA